MITVNDKEYDPETMTESQRHLLNQVANCRSKASAAGMDQQIAQVAEQQFIAALIDALEEPVEIAEEEVTVQ